MPYALNDIAIQNTAAVHVRSLNLISVIVNLPCFTKIHGIESRKSGVRISQHLSGKRVGQQTPWSLSVRAREQFELKRFRNARSFGTGLIRLHVLVLIRDLNFLINVTRRESVRGAIRTRTIGDEVIRARDSRRVGCDGCQRRAIERIEHITAAVVRHAVVTNVPPR